MDLLVTLQLIQFSRSSVPDVTALTISAQQLDEWLTLLQLVKMCVLWWNTSDETLNTWLKLVMIPFVNHPFSPGACLERLMNINQNNGCSTTKLTCLIGAFLWQHYMNVLLMWVLRERHNEFYLELCLQSKRDAISRL